MAARGSNLSGGRRGNWDLKGRDPAAWVVGGSVYLGVVVGEFGRQAVSLVVDVVVERPDLRTVGDLVPLVWLLVLGLALLLDLQM